VPDEGENPVLTVKPPDSARRFSGRARDRRRQAAAPWLVGALVAAILAMIGWVVFGTGLLGVARIEVTGTQVLRPDQVRAAAQVTSGTPLARLDLDAVADRVERLSPVKTAAVSREWPSTLIIAITERTPVAAVPLGKVYALLDATGVAYFQVTGKPAKLPLVKLAQPGPGDLTTRSALEVLAALTPQLRSRLVSLVADSPTRIRLELAGAKVIIWGDSANSATKAAAATALLDEPQHTIDVSAGDVVTMR
jgi:cell division protein FtsQ